VKSVGCASVVPGQLPCATFRAGFDVRRLFSVSTGFSTKCQEEVASIHPVSAANAILQIFAFSRCTEDQITRLGI